VTSDKQSRSLVTPEGHADEGRALHSLLHRRLFSRKSASRRWNSSSGSVACFGWIDRGRWDRSARDLGIRLKSPPRLVAIGHGHRLAAPGCRAGPSSCAVTSRHRRRSRSSCTAVSDKVGQRRLKVPDRPHATDPRTTSPASDCGTHRVSFLPSRHRARYATTAVRFWDLLLSYLTLRLTSAQRRQIPRHSSEVFL
jgi:hypothetical protein